MNPKHQSITLYYREGNSDKIYQASIDSQDDGFIVRFAFGRRGSTLQTGCKTPVPVDYATAKKIFDKLVKEKTAKGYTPGADGTPYQQTDNQDRSTGVLPQMLNPIDEAEATALLKDPAWAAQEKLDGRRHGLGTGGWCSFLDQIAPLADDYDAHLGGSDSFGKDALVLDRVAQQAWFAPRQAAKPFVGSGNSRPD